MAGKRMGLCTEHYSRQPNDPVYCIRSITCRSLLRGVEVIPAVLRGCDAVSLGEGSTTDRSSSSV
jgi:hypothetical protein